MTQPTTTTFGSVCLMQMLGDDHLCVCYRNLVFGGVQLLFRIRRHQKSIVELELF